jgi:hypothetical protein
MKDLFLICFLIISFWSFGQDCGCQEEIRTFDFGKSIKLDNPEDYEKDTIYISTEKVEDYSDIYFIYLVNRSDSVFQDFGVENWGRNGVLMVEALDSFGNWRNIRRLFVATDCTFGINPYLRLEKDSYMIGGVRHKSNQGNFKTQVRFRLNFQNHQFYSESFTDSIQYCQFINCYDLLRNYVFGIESSNDYLLFQKENRDLKYMFLHRYFITSIFINLKKPHQFEKLYQLLKFHNIKFRYSSRLEQSVFANRLRNDSTCLENYDDTLSRYIPFWYSIEVLEKKLEKQIEKKVDLTEINRSKQNLKILNKSLPIYNNIFTPNNERHFIQKDNEYFIKVECLENYLVKIRVKSN